MIEWRRESNKITMSYSSIDDKDVRITKLEQEAEKLRRQILDHEDDDNEEREMTP